MGNRRVFCFHRRFGDWWICTDITSQYLRWSEWIKRKITRLTDRLRWFYWIWTGQRHCWSLIVLLCSVESKTINRVTCSYWNCEYQWLRSIVLNCKCAQLFSAFYMHRTVSVTHHQTRNTNHFRSKAVGLNGVNVYLAFPFVDNVLNNKTRYGHPNSRNGFGCT